VPQLCTSKANEVERRYAIAREKAVQGGGPRIARLAGVTQEQPTSASGEDERRAESGGTSPDNDDVEHNRLNCKGTAISAFSPTMQHERFRL
jgi:hypothetical protein